jgi:hypothetical protein
MRARSVTFLVGPNALVIVSEQISPVVRQGAEGKARKQSTQKGRV